jgi:aryl-alcohol dehydrogenase-like predicted oxidoreductase
MTTTTLGQTGLHVSRIASGTWHVDWPMPRWCEAVVEGYDDDNVAAVATQAAVAHPSPDTSLTSSVT